MLVLCYIQNFFKSVNFESRQCGCVPLLTAFFVESYRGIYGLSWNL